MARALFIIAVLAAAFTVFAAIDCARTPHGSVRGLPKALWFVVIVLLPVIGALLWLVIGRGPVRPAPPAAPPPPRRLTAGR